MAKTSSKSDMLAHRSRPGRRARTTRGRTLGSLFTLLALLPFTASAASFDRLQDALDGHEEAEFSGLERGGLREGRGTLAWPDGRVYEGEFYRGAPDGEGVLTWPDGLRFKGLVVEGVIRGEARVDFPDGSRYRGPLENGIPNGLATFRYPDRSRYTGEYVDGRRHGWGEYKSADGTRYVGAYRRGERAGQGTLIRADGTLYRGGFLGNAPDGYGVRVSPRGKSLTLEYWQDGIRQTSMNIRESDECHLAHGEHSWMVRGSACAGSRANGTGRAVSTDGTLFIPRGRFEQGRLVEGSIVALGQPPSGTS